MHPEVLMAREKKIDMVILGLLSHEDLTGYDIKKRMDGPISFFWKGSFGNIYPALKELENGGLITRSEASSGGREKITYHITASGKKALTSWLKEEQCINEMRYETLLKLFFGGAAKDKKVTVHNIEVFEEQVKGELAILKEYEKSLKDQLNIDDHVCYYLTVTFGIETYGAYLRWCAKAKKALR